MLEPGRSLRVARGIHAHQLLARRCGPPLRQPVDIANIVQNGDQQLRRSLLFRIRHCRNRRKALVDFANARLALGNSELRICSALRNLAALRQLRLGAQIGDSVEVISGLKAGDVVARDPVAALQALAAQRKAGGGRD